MLNVSHVNVSIHLDNNVWCQPLAWDHHDISLFRTESLLYLLGGLFDAGGKLTDMQSSYYLSEIIKTK